MILRLLPATVMVVLSLSAAAQTSAAPNPVVVKWSPDDTEHCTVVFRDGVAREEIKHGGRILDVYAPTVRDKKTFAVLVGVANENRAAFDVDPVRMGAYSDDQNSVQLRSIDADKKIAKENASAHRWAMLGAGLSGYAAGSSNTTATVHNADGTTSTVTMHDNTATQQANANAVANRDAINARSAKQASSIMRRNTVAAGAFVTGFVYLERPKEMGKKSNVAEFVIDLGDTVYIFPFASGAVPR